MTADKTCHFDVPAAAGMAGNQVMDCTNSKISMRHLMVKNNTSAASTCKVVSSESKTYLVFLTTQYLNTIYMLRCYLLLFNSLLFNYIMFY
jgi:hypothetical protein